MKAELGTKLNTVASVQLVQYAGLLYMNNCELDSYIRTQLEENPVLEALPTRQSQPDRIALGKSLSRSSRERHYDGDKDALDFIADSTGEETLYGHIHEQLLGSAHSATAVCVAEYLAQCLNDNGYLEQPCTEIADRLGLDCRVIHDGLRVLQSLSPAGIGARDLSECLLLQLERRSDAPKYAREIVCCHLHELADNRYKSMAKSLGAALPEVYAACAFVKQLDPKPGARFLNGSGADYIIPDAAVVRTPEGFEIILNDGWIPELMLSPYYLELMRTGDAEVKSYLAGKVDQARIAIHNIRQRKSTLVACIREIVEAQKEFFLCTSSELAPLSQHELARRLSLNESTLSRAVHGKYIQCSRGVYPLRAFFSRAAFSSGSESLSPSFIAAKIKQITESEDPAHPLSDQKIVDLMKSDGIDIARRTVAKYRAELNIPPALERKRSQ